MRAAALLLLVLLAATLPASRGLSWRLFAGREECLTEFMPDHQWEMVKDKEGTPENSHVLIDLGFTVSSRYGTETSQAVVDLQIVGPTGQVVHEREGTGEEEIAVTADGSRGPWRACFKVSRGQILRPSVVVKVAYFTVNHMSLVGTQFEWQRAPPAAPAIPGVDHKTLGTQQQVQDMTYGLQRLDYYLLNVTNEQRYLYARTSRHLKTVQSTLTRTFWFSLAIWSGIIAASVAQAVGVRLMFKGSRRQGLII